MPTKVNKSLCDERSGNILKKIEEISKQIDMLVNNHLKHTDEKIDCLQKQITNINNNLKKINIRFEMEDDRRKEKKDFNKWLLPILVGAGMKIVEFVLQYLNVI